MFLLCMRRVSFMMAWFLFLAVAGLAADQPEPWDSPHFSMPPKDLYLAASAVASADGTDVTVLDEEDSIFLDADGRLTHTAYMVYKVLTQKGVERWDSVSRDWQPWRADRPVFRARVITPDFAVHELDPDTISDAPAREDEARIYSDQRVVRAPLPAIAPGSVVERELVTVLNPYFLGCGMEGGDAFGHVAVPVQHRRVVIDAPSSLPIRYVLQQLPDLKPQRHEAGGRVKLVFEQGPIAPLEKAERYLPSGTLEHPTLLYSAGSTWQRVAEGYAKIVEGPLAAAQVKPLVEGLTQGKPSRNDKEQAILGFLDKEVRYTGIEFGENSIIPHATDDTLTRKYGDCKDKALLLVAMLRAAEIPAYMALLNVGGQMGAVPELAGIGVFNHAIVVVPGNPDQWIDPTDEYARLGQLPIADQGRMALMVRAGTQGLVRTPEDPSPTNGLEEIREFHLAENGPARVVQTIHPRGCLESRYRRNYTDRQNEKIRQNLTSYMEARFLAEKLDRWDRSDPTDLSRPFELVLESSKAKRGFTELDSAAAAIRPDGLFSLLPAELQKREETEDKASDSTKPKKKRTADYELPEASTIEWHYRVIPPLGFQPGPLPHDVKSTLGAAQLTEQFSAEANGVVHADLRFDTVKRRITVAEATEMRDKVAELEAGEATLINFLPLGKILQKQGKMRESFQTYRDLIAQHPKEAVHHLQIAQALLEAGMGEAARNEARQAIKLEPDSALAQKTLANILEYDVVGRRLRPGSDFAGAASALRAAAQLDPEDKALVGNLAILLEYNDEGLRYGPGAKLQDAVAEYRKLPQEKLASLGLQNNLAFDLFYAGEFAEAYKYAETLNPQPKVLLVACEAAQHGSEAGIAEANKRTSGEAELKSTLKAAGEALMKMRRYALAADLLEAGAAGDTAARTMGLAAALRKARRHEETTFGNDPKDLVMKAFLLNSDPRQTMGDIENLSSKNGLAVLKNTDPEEIEKSRIQARQMRHQLARQGLSWDFTVDLTLQMAEPRGEGNDAVGYRERLQIPGGQTMTFFVVKEKGQYKFLDTAQEPNALGLEILDRVASHDLGGARVLLDWVREDQHLTGGDDPLSGMAFPRFWTKGKDADARQMRLAAAAILVETKPTAKQGVAILEEAKKSARDDAEKTNIDAALLDGYNTLDDFEKLLAVGAEMARLHPESMRLFFAESWALRALGRFSEAQTLAQERLKRSPGDADTIKVLWSNAVAQQDYRSAYGLGRQLVDAGKADASVMNNLAWLTLFFERPQGPDIEAALKSSQSSPNNPHILHTLGCLYAEAGKPKEAYDVLIQAMDLSGADEPDSDFWYAFGRIAEQYGEKDVAQMDYAKVTKPKRAVEIPDSCYRLAQNRLKALQSPASPGGPSAQTGELASHSGGEN